MPEITARLSNALADRYKIERHLGEGGMANVYLAEDLKHHRKVALKVLRPELAAVLGAERFVQEIETTANLQHPHILPLHDSGDADGSEHIGRESVHRLGSTASPRSQSNLTRWTGRSAQSDRRTRNQHSMTAAIGRSISPPAARWQGQLATSAIATERLPEGR